MLERLKEIFSLMAATPPIRGTSVKRFPPFSLFYGKMLRFLKPLTVWERGVERNGISLGVFEIFCDIQGLQYTNCQKSESKQ